jgi:serine/threonine protein kinase
VAREHRLLPGAVFAGAYEVERLIGQGTMGSVYRVRERPTGAVRALKLMKAELVSDPKFAQRFEQEAQIGVRVPSPHLVQVLASGVDAASGLPWLAMEFLDGVTLDAWLDGPPAPDVARVRAALDQLFGAIAAAHDANIVHRDLKPENVVVTTISASDGGARTADGAPFVKVLDFGIAKIVRESKTLTGTTPGLGTPLWTAPEQSKEGESIRPASDVWALGLIAFRMLTGKIFWRASNDEKSNAYEIALELMRAPIPPASERAEELGVEAKLPAGFDGWFERAVARDVGARFPSAAEAHAALAAVLDAPTPAMQRAAHGTIVMPVTPAKRPSRAPAAAAVAVVVVAPPAEPAPSDAASSPPRASPMASTFPDDPKAPAKLAAPRSGRAWLWVVVAVLLAGSAALVVFTRLLRHHR